MSQLLQARPDRHRYQGLKTAVPTRCDVTWGEARSVQVQAGAILSIVNAGGSATAWLTALPKDQTAFSPGSLDVPNGLVAPLDPATFDSRAMAQVAAARDTSLAKGTVFHIFDHETAAGEMFVTTAKRDCTVYLIAPVTRDFLTSGGGARFELRIQPPEGASADRRLPEPLGRVRDEWRVSRGTAHAYQLKKGQFVQILDVEGQQCSDFMAMRSAALESGIERYIDSTVSRSMNRAAYPQPGLHDKFFDQDMRPLLAVRQDTVGRHDTFGLACNERGYEERGFPGHLNCSDNITAAFAPYGIAARRAWPAINFFWNSWILPTDNRFASDEAWSRPGDYVVMQALTDLVCVSTACPDDVDPINGWNPTDIHVRIYEEDSSISHSVSWRARPDDAATLTKHSPFRPRTAALTSAFHVSRDLWVPSHFDATGAIEEYWACKTAATLQDMSGLRKFDVVGPDAQALLQRCLTRDVSKLSRHRGFYALICDERGSVIDDGTLFRLEETAFRWCCGSDNSALHLREQAERLGLKAHVLSLGDKMPNLALQGPRSREILREIVFTQPSQPSLDNLKWFGFTIARLRDRDGPMFMLCRTGFTGELGYEVFCDSSDAIEIWDGLVEAGARHGLVPMGNEALNMLRIEAGLMVAGAEFGPDSDAMESGLGFAVDLKKPEFIGRPALERNAAATRRKLVGLHFAGNEAPAHGDPVFLDRDQVGVVTSGCDSPQLGHAIAMARVAVENSEVGCELEVGRLDGHMKRLPAYVTDLPFLDPKREKARA